jgi:hypothetical protein
MKNIREEVKKVFESKKFLFIAVILGILIITSVIFQAGVFVGFHKASFGRDWGENYERNFGMMRGLNFPPRGMMDQENFPNAHGAVGKIIKIETSSIIVADKDGTEKVILIKDDTNIRSVKTDIKIGDLKMDDFVVVIGSPNTQGQIEAKFIRVMPAGIPNIPFPPKTPEIPQVPQSPQTLNTKPIQ